MRAGHTAGPWVCDSATFEFDGASFGEAAYIVSKDGEQFPTNAANARLIATAPEMLAALDGLKAILDRAESNASGNPEWEAVSARVNAARAAIAKARGEA